VCKAKLLTDTTELRLLSGMMWPRVVWYIDANILDERALSIFKMYPDNGAEPFNEYIILTTYFIQ
jgi:hypothetical protein